MLASNLGQANNRLFLTSQIDDTVNANVYLIAVPTLLEKDHSIDASHLISAIRSVDKVTAEGDLVVIESSVAVGMTREYLSSLRMRGVLCGMSPERADPGRIRPLFQDIPKVIAGIDTHSLMKIQAVYEKVFTKLVPVSSVEAAEMTKLYENCYRLINIQFVNEVADLCGDLDLDPYEVVDAASTKPFGYQRFTPSLGIGGHCIPINPYYMFRQAKRDRLPLLRRATEDSWLRPIQMAKNLIDAYGRSCRVCLVGLGFKAGESSLSCSPQVLYANYLLSAGLQVFFYDQLVTCEPVNGLKKLESFNWTDSYLETHFDVVVVAVLHHTSDAIVLRNLAKTDVKWFCPKPEAFFRHTSLAL